MKHNFKELQVWNESMNFTIELYQLISKLPDFEKFGVSSQLARASVSIPSNIAEGCSRNSTNDQIRFIEYSIGSCFEVETQLILVSKIYPKLKNESVDLCSKIVLIQRKLGGFKRMLRQSLN